MSLVGTPPPPQANAARSMQAAHRPHDGAEEHARAVAATPLVVSSGTQTARIDARIVMG